MGMIQFEWRTLPEFPEYEVTSLGDIRRKKTKQQHAVNLTGTTETVQLSKDGKRYHRTLTSLVKQAFPGVLYP